MTQLNGLQGQNGLPSTYPLAAHTAKRLVGVLAVSEWPVRFAGQVVQCVQRKRHPYDEWDTVTKAGEVDASNPQGWKYRVCYTGTSATTPVDATKDLV